MTGAEAEADADADAQRTMAEDDTQRGPRVVMAVYAAIVVIAGVMGFVLGTIRPKNLDPELFFVIQLPPTPVGVAIYGMVTVAVGFGILLGLVVYVSDRYDVEGAERAKR